MTPRLAILLSLAGALGAACTPGPVGVASLPKNALGANLLAHWTFDEGTLITVGDSSGNGNDGVISGSNWHWIDDGKFGGGLHLSGNDAFGGGSQVTVGGFPQATAAFTVSAWYRLPSADTGPALSEISALLSNEMLGGGGWALNLNLPLPAGNMDANYQFAYWSGPNYQDARCVCLVLDQWVHIAAVVDAVVGGPGTLTLYINGVAQKRIDVPIPIARGITTLYIGRWPGAGRFLGGDLDDIAIWTRALVAEEIALLGTMPVPNAM